MKEIKCFKSVNNYFPKSYLEDSLASDAKTLGLKDQKFKSLKGELEPLLLNFGDKTTSTENITADRDSLINSLNSALGYYQLENAPNYKPKRELTINGHKYLAPVEASLRFKGGKELWLLSHYPEKSASEFDESLGFDKETDNEFFLEEAFLVNDNRNKSYSLAIKNIIEAIFDGDQTDCEFIIVNSGNKMYLLERGKWQEGPQSYLELDLLSLYSEINATKYYTIADSLFSPESFPISSSANFHDTLDKNSYKKATAVTKVLRDRVRESIELIADEVLDQYYNHDLNIWKNKNLEDAQVRSACATELFDQTLKYIYRMLFMLFTESQEQAKGALPVQSSAYQLSCSIEKLRELAEKPYLTSKGSQSHFIFNTLEKSFNIYYQGYNTYQSDAPEATNALGFNFPSLGVKLFSPNSTPLFKAVKIPDSVMQEVLKKISLAQTGTGKNTKTHRVHYAALGLNQLGAVYEGLLVLKPEILTEKVFLLTKSKKEAAHRYVPYVNKAAVKDAKILTDHNKRSVTKNKNQFILTARGLDRKLSASFYTPEVLTRFLAKEAVDNLLGEKPSLEKMETLKILEPAMGSGAFLNAVVDEISPRMAKHYEQEASQIYNKKYSALSNPDSKVELGKIKKYKPKPIHFYKSQAKNHLMRHCVYGVDLNSTAVELAKISLWLNCLHEDGHLPFLDMKLKTGNSLIGAWVNKHKNPDTDMPHWFYLNSNMLKPHIEGKILGEKSKPYIANKDKLKKLKQFTSNRQNDSKDESLHKKMNQLNKKVQSLYKTHTSLITKYNDKIMASHNPQEKEELFNEYRTSNTAYNTLRTMMDVWCSFWFWPHENLDQLPTAEQFIDGLLYLSETNLKYGKEQLAQIKKSGYRFLTIARGVALKMNFLHYDLEFADVFESNQGFDLVLGNPPWAPVRWEDADFFELYSPGINEIKGDAKVKTKRYGNFLDKNKKYIPTYINEKSKVEGTANFLKNSNTYTFEDKSQSNTYRYFYQRFYQLTKISGTHALLAQDGILTDKGCIEIRPTFYNELSSYFRFINTIKLFEDVHPLIEFVISISIKGKKNVEFKMINNLYHSETVQKCRVASLNSTYKGLKNSDGGWELAGHPDRIILVDKVTLKELAKLNSDSNPLKTRLPIIHGKVELDIIKSLARHEVLLDKFEYTQLFNEANSSKKSLITRIPGKAKSICQSVITGPNIFVATPAFKQPNQEAKSNVDFNRIDLSNIDKCPDNYYPDTVYQITKEGLSSSKYLNQTDWGEIMIDKYRMAARSMICAKGERTLQTAIIPPGVAHINGINTLCFQNYSELIRVTSLSQSLIYDFFCRSISGSNLTKSFYKKLPILNKNQLKSKLITHLAIRTLRLNSISTYYQELWQDQFSQSFKDCDFEGSDFKPKLPYSKLTKKWVRNSCIRDRKARDQALCEIDAIVALLFNFEKDTLLNLYRSQFGVLQNNFQDREGQIPNPEKYHFPRFEAMSKAYDHFAKIIGKAEKTNLKKFVAKKGGSKKQSNKNLDKAG